MNIRKWKQNMVLVLICSIILRLCSPMQVFSQTDSLDEQKIYDVTFQITNQWDGAYQGEIIIYNLGTQPIKDWNLKFQTKDEITNLWNGIINSHENTIYEIYNEYYNSVIEPGDYIVIGYQATYTNIIDLPNEYKFDFKQDIITIGEEYLYEYDNYDVIYKVNKQWKDSFSGEFIIKNKGNKVLENWALQFIYHHQITNTWNADICYNDKNIYTIKNKGYNQDIEVNSSISFGFTALYDDILILPEHFELLMFEEETETSLYDVIFNITSDWNSGFIGEIIITNKSNKVIEDWSLEFDFENNIEQFWTADIQSIEGNHYIIKNKGYNSNIFPGESMVLGFSGNPGNVNKKPVNFKLNQIVDISSTYDNNEVEFIINKENFSFDDNTKSYYLYNELSYLNGKLSKINNINSCTYEIKNSNGTILKKGEFVPENEWVIFDIGFVVGVNYIEVKAIYNDGSYVQDKMLIFCCTDSNLKNLDLDLEMMIMMA